MEERSESPSHLLTTGSSWLFPSHNLLPQSLLPLIEGGNPLVCALGHSVASLKVKYGLGMEKLEAVLGGAGCIVTATKAIGWCAVGRG